MDENTLKEVYIAVLGGLQPNPGYFLLKIIVGFLPELTHSRRFLNPNPHMDSLSDSWSCSSSFSPGILSRRPCESPASGSAPLSLKQTPPATCPRPREMSRSIGHSQGQNASAPSSASVSSILSNFHTILKAAKPNFSTMYAFLGTLRSASNLGRSLGF